MKHTRLQELELRVAGLEREIRDIQKLIGSNGSSESEPWWQRTAGMFKDDPVWAEIVQLGQKIRREEITMEFRENRRNPRGKRTKAGVGVRQIQKGKK